MLSVELLGKVHDREGFDCGKPELNGYLRQTARQHQDKGISRTFVLTDDDSPETVKGFFSLVVCEVLAFGLPEEWRKKYPNKLPGVKLARLAVRKEDQSKGYGGMLLVEAMRRVTLGAEQIGIAAFFVDAIDENARRFYEHYGFISFPGERLEMFLPMATLRKLLEEES